MTYRPMLGVSMPGLLALLLLGCGGSSTNVGGSPPASQSVQPATTASAPATSPAAPSGPLDVCALATQSDVDAAAGVSLSAAASQPAPNPGTAKCSWAGTGAPVGGLYLPGITIAVVALPAGASATSLPFFSGQVPSARRISGLGDVAASLSPGQLGPNSVQIFVAVHSWLITLTLVNSGAPHTGDPVQSMTTLARAAVARLP